MGRSSQKHGIAVTGLWLPLPLEFLRSRGCAELSLHGAKLFLDVLAMLGPNANGNGDISLAPKVMIVRGWNSRSSLSAAIRELLEYGLLFKTRQGSRLDCSLFACSLFPLDCDPKKIDVKPGCYRQTDYMGKDVEFAKPATENNPAHWRQARKTQTVTPPRDEVSTKHPPTVRAPKLRAVN